MKKIRSYRLLSVLLVVLLVVGLFPTTVLAASGYCPTCGKTCPYTLEYEQWTDSVHCTRHWCSNCGEDQCSGVNSESHTFSNNGYCTKCGYYSSSHDHSVCYHTSTYVSWSGCRWYEYCRNCGELVDWGVSHNYSYGDWAYYSTSQHRRSATCSSCGETTYGYGNHSARNTSVPYDSAQHKYGSYCATCQSFIGSVSYQNHTFTYGSWQNYNGTQHRRLRTCSACGYSDYEYANHSLSYGSWSSANGDQHKRTVSCSCGYSTTEYADHTLTVSRQSISDTQHKVTSKCSVCGYSTTTNEAHSFTYGEWQSDSDTQHRRTKSCVCGYSGYDYGDHNDADGDSECDDCGYLMSRFSVTVPANLSLTVSQDGTVHASVNAAIVNNSTGAVKVTAVTVRAGCGWTLVPYNTNMANAKVDTKQIGFTINHAETKQTGSSEALTLGSGWNIAKNADLPLNYDAVVSAMSEPVNEQVLTLIFVLDWAN